MLFEAPMHPYRMQRLIKERGKDEVINVMQRASLYQTIHRLERDGLIRARKVAREENRPERTIYELTEVGQQVLLDWMRQILSTPSKEFPEFPAAISFLPVLAPKDAQKQLEKRVIALDTEIKRIDREIAKVSFLPRLFLLETELMRESLVMELKWVRSIVEDLRSGELTWSKTWLRRMAAEFGEKHEETE
jgi:DNA-binding PadR family transcriptional regulator